MYIEDYEKVIVALVDVIKAEINTDDDVELIEEDIVSLADTVLHVNCFTASYLGEIVYHQLLMKRKEAEWHNKQKSNLGGLK